MRRLDGRENALLQVQQTYRSRWLCGNDIAPSNDDVPAGAGGFVEGIAVLFDAAVDNEEGGGGGGGVDAVDSWECWA